MTGSGYHARVAGYSGTPLPKKLGIKTGSRVALVGAPDDFASTLGELPPGVRFVPVGDGELDVVVSFVTDERDLPERFMALKPLLQPAGGLWIAWPKRVRGATGGLSENTVREVGLAAGLVDNKVCAIDERWSGLRFVYRRADRPGVAK
jgi:hypothetical protein